MKYVLVGKIVNTHGVKGEVRILSEFPYKDKVFKENIILYIGKNKIAEQVISYRHHKQFEMVTFKNITNINDVLKYKGLYIFVNKAELELNENEYLDEDLVNLTIVCNNVEVGTVLKVVRYNKNNLLLVKNKENNFYIPYNFDIIKEINLKNGIIVINDIKGLI